MVNLRFVFEDAGVPAEWSLTAGHNCAPGGYGERFALRWQPDRATAYKAAFKAKSRASLIKVLMRRTLTRLAVCCGLWLCMLMVSQR